MPPDLLPGQPAPPLLSSTIPAAGIVGTAALREAADGSYQDIINRLREAVSTLFASRPGYADVLAVFPDTTVVAVSEPGRGGRIWSYPYTLDGRAVTLGTPVEMVETFAPVASRLREAAGGVLAADHPAGPDGSRFAVRVIRAGLSGNGNFYPDAVLREAVPLFEGVRVFVKSDAEHLKGGGKDVRGLIGKITGVRFVEGAAPDRGEVLGTLSVIDPAEAIAVKLREAASRDMADLFGLSVDAEGTVRGGTVAGRPIKTATAITRVRSVDLIVEPGAGGAVISLIEALADPAPASPNKDDAMLRQHLIATILATRPDLLNGVVDLAALTDDALTGLFREALANPPASSATPAPGAVGDEVRRLVEAQMRAVTQTIAARQMARDRIGRSRLPQRAKDRLAAEFEARADFREADVDARIADEVAYLAPAAGGGTVADLGDASLMMGESRADKFREALGAFWDPEHKDHRHAQSLKDLYVLATGDKRVTGRVADCDRALLREALDGDDFASVFADSLNKRMQRVYGAYREPDVYLDLVEVVDVKDFRQQSRVAWGGYGDLPEVAKNDPYTELDSPQEADPATYRIKKRGRLESIALEDIQNDDVQFVRRIPVDLGRASKRTLGKFVLDFLRTNPLVMDGKPLFHADHGNLITDPLGSTGYDKLRLLMKGQMDIGGHDKIGVNPKFLWVPDKLEAVAYDLFTLNQRNDPDFITTLKPTIRPVWYWTDPTDWCVSADPRDIPTIELGFLNGQREPEIFIQDSPTSGSLFTNDQITWKVRHTYGGTVLDWRGLGKSEVAD